MPKQKPVPVRYVQPYRYPSPNVPLSAIRRFARQVAEKFQPEKIVLFGSYAYGTPHEESDVDLLVIMPCRNEIDQSIRIDVAFERQFSLDLIVRTPRHIKLGLREDDCDWFLREIMEKGKVLYEAPHGSMGPQGRGRFRRSASNGRGQSASKRSCVLPLSARSGKVPESIPARFERSRATKPRSGRPS